MVSAAFPAFTAAAAGDEALRFGIVYPGRELPFFRPPSDLEDPTELVEPARFLSTDWPPLGGGGSGVGVFPFSFGGGGAIAPTSSPFNSSATTATSADLVRVSPSFSLAGRPSSGFSSLSMRVPRCVFNTF